ncbi:hypothetical protein DERF_000977 [Dermatophagoides farinae]|uniref:Uncharacterized protein n=1 Tax=Dermatophagoides farinae TaxID=6954 RepID=A0A922I8J6_DERFA|nr:hypothetical protein DERF_000977 [Dermatophagoides farinae]
MVIILVSSSSSSSSFVMATDGLKCLKFNSEFVGIHFAREFSPFSMCPYIHAVHMQIGVLLNTVNVK